MSSSSGYWLRHSKEEGTHEGTGWVHGGSRSGATESVGLQDAEQKVGWIRFRENTSWSQVLSSLPCGPYTTSN